MTREAGDGKQPVGRPGAGRGHRHGQAPPRPRPRGSRASAGQMPSCPCAPFRPAPQAIVISNAPDWRSRPRATSSRSQPRPERARRGPADDDAPHVAVAGKGRGSPRPRHVRLPASPVPPPAVRPAARLPASRSLSASGSVSARVWVTLSAIQSARARSATALGHADRLARGGAFVDADEDAFLRRPRPGNGIGRHVLAQLRIDPVGSSAHRQFAQRGQVALGEEGRRARGPPDPADRPCPARSRVQQVRRAAGRSARSRRPSPARASGTVSRTRTPVMRATVSFSVSMCWMFSVV